MIGDCRCLERQHSQNRLRGRLDAMQRLTQGIHVPVIELNVIVGVHARPDADRGADDERHGLGFGFAHGLGRRPIVAALMKELVRLCNGSHKHTYVRGVLMYASLA